jgi:hypothetical protein
LGATQNGDAEPSRVFFFGEASLAHEAARTLLDVGDTVGAVREFRRSVEKRQASTFARTHVVTLGYLGAAQAKSGQVDEAIDTWARALNALDGINSGRVRRTVGEMDEDLAQFERRGIAEARVLRNRTASYLRDVEL